LATPISGMPMPTPEVCFLTWQLRRTTLPKEGYGNSFSVDESDTQPSS